MSGIGAIGAVAAAQAGMRSADRRAQRAASDIAQGSESPGGADLPGDVVSLSTAQVQMAASVQVVRTENQMQKTLLDLFA